MLRIDRKNKIVRIFCEDQGKEEPCPECGVLFSANGTGPENKPKVTKFLQSIVFDDVLGVVPPAFHDYCYLLCPAGWVVVMRYNGEDVSAWSKKSADSAYLKLMLEQVDAKCRNWFSKRFYTRLAKVYYKAVVNMGDSSFKHGH